MISNPLSQRLDIFMSDLIPLYADFVGLLQVGSEITVEAFQKLFDKNQIEYLHYCGGTPSVPFQKKVEKDLFQLAAAYLYFPKEVLLPKVQLFSLLLIFFLYGTQPLLGNESLPPLAIDISLDAFEGVFRAPPTLSSFSSSSPSSSIQEPYSLEEHLAISLHVQHCFAVQPSVDNRAYITAVVRAHEQHGVPIFNEEFKKTTCNSQIRPCFEKSALNHRPVDIDIQLVSDPQLKKMLVDYSLKRESHKELFSTK